VQGIVKVSKTLFGSGSSRLGEKEREKMSNPSPYTNTSPEANRIWRKQPLLLPLMFITGIALMMLGLLNMDTLAQEEKGASSGQPCQYAVDSGGACANAP
jgi:hypothetical protein